AQARMLCGLLTKDRIVPSLLCFVPANKGGGFFNKWIRPSGWLFQEVYVYFVDPISMEWDEKSGLLLKITKEWVVKVMPYIK
ncbi:hypothetical protein FOA52_009484, partial [Chlamydomonas sp. UWO 241]